MYEHKLFLKYPILQNYISKTLQAERHKMEFIKGPASKEETRFI